MEPQHPTRSCFSHTYLCLEWGIGQRIRNVDQLESTGLPNDRLDLFILNSYWTVIKSSVRHSWERRATFPLFPSPATASCLSCKDSPTHICDSGWGTHAFTFYTPVNRCKSANTGLFIEIFALRGNSVWATFHKITIFWREILSHVVEWHMDGRS